MRNIMTERERAIFSTWNVLILLLLLNLVEQVETYWFIAVIPSKHHRCMLSGLKQIPRWSSLLKTPPDPCMSADPDQICGFPWGANERHRSQVPICFFRPGVNRGEGRSSLWLRPQGLKVCKSWGEAPRLHRSIVPAARPETHPLLPGRWMSQLWCQLHTFFHLDWNMCLFKLVFIPTPSNWVPSTQSTLTNGQQVKFRNGP